MNSQKNQSCERSGKTTRSFDKQALKTLPSHYTTPSCVESLQASSPMIHGRQYVQMDQETIKQFATLYANHLTSQLANVSDKTQSQIRRQADIVFCITRLTQVAQEAIIAYKNSTPSDSGE